MKGRPIFQEINELHHAAVTSQEAVLKYFHVYRNEDANETCCRDMEAHRCNFFQLSIDKKSDYLLLYNTQKIDTSDNTIYFAGAGKLISWHSSNSKKSWKGYNIIFKSDFLSTENNNYNFLKEFPFLRNDNTASVNIPQDDKTIFELCEKMLYEQNNNLTDANIMRHYLYVLLYIIRRIYFPQYSIPVSLNISRNMELARRFEDLIDKQYLSYRSLNKYAEKLFVSPKYLTQVTKNIYGKTAKEMIMHKILSEAKSLLIQTNLTLTQIAAELHFEDTSNFIKFFKKLSGKGPSAYRQSR